MMLKITYAGLNNDMEKDLDWTLAEHGWIRGASGFCPVTQQRDISYEQLPRSCKTCRSEDYFEDGHDSYGAVVPLHWVRMCNDKGQALIDAVWEELSEATPDNRLLQNGVQIPPVVNCPHWEEK